MAVVLVLRLINESSIFCTFNMWEIERNVLFYIQIIMRKWESIRVVVALVLRQVMLVFQLISFVFIPFLKHRS